MTGSQLEGMCGGIYNIKSHHDCDLLLTSKHFKLCTPRGNNIKNPPLLVLHVNEEYDAFFFVEEDDNFPGYIKLSGDLMTIQKCIPEIKVMSVYFSLTFRKP
jgi:hypothetical protein